MQPPRPAPPPAPAPRARRGVPVLVPHLIWEALLLLVVVASGAALLVATPTTWDALARQVSLAGLLAVALALSLRTRTPNLAVAGVAGVAAALYAELVAGSADVAPLLALVIVLAVMLPVGLVLGLVTGATSAPAWAVSLGGLAAAQAVMLGLGRAEGVVVQEHLPTPLRSSTGWFVIFLVLSLGGAALFAIPAVRRLAGPEGARPLRFSGRKLLAALLGMGGSTVLAALAGVVYVHEYAFFQPASFGIYQLLTALAAVLIGGVSAFGGRGGITGTVLGVTLVAVVGIRLNTSDLDTEIRQGLLWGAIALAIVVGALISRLLEAIAPQFPDTAPRPDAAPPPVAPPPLPAPAAALSAHPRPDAPAPAPVPSQPPAPSPPPVPSQAVARDPATSTAPSGGDTGSTDTDDETREISGRG